MASQLNAPFEVRISNLLLEYAQNAPATLPLPASLSLRDDLAIESLSLVSLVLRIGEEFGVDIVDSTLELASLKTVGDFVALARTIQKQNSTSLPIGGGAQVAL